METCTSNINLPQQEPQNAVMQNQEEDDFPLSDPDPSKRHPFQCDVCDRILTTKQSLQFHKRTHEDLDIRKMFRCEICDATFKSRNGLSYHLETKHTAGCERPKLPCPTCGRIFKSEEGRKIHLTIQHGAGGPVFKCKECPMVFARKNHLDLHMTTHGTGLHVCTTCGKSYARLKDLSRHEEYCGVKELCCPVCGKQLRTEQALENHRKKCRSGGWKMEPGVGEKRGRPRKGDSGGEEVKVRVRRSKYDQFIGLEHLAVPTALIEEVKPVKIDMKPAEPTPRRFPCGHCPLKFVTMKALENHGQRRHWEVLGLAEPAPEKRGRKRTRPLERVPKKLGRPRKIVNYVDPEELPEDESDAEMDEVDPVKSEDITGGEPTTIDPVENIVGPETTEDKRKSTDQIKEQTSDNLAADEDIKEEEIEFDDYEFNHFDVDSTDSDDSVKEHVLEGIVQELKNLQKSTSVEVDTLAQETDACEDPHTPKELVIRLEKLDYSSLVETSSIPLSQTKCGDCRKTFAHHYQLAQHWAKEHATTKRSTYLPSFHCEECDKSYLVEYKLKAHKEKVHGIVEDGESSNARTCKHCGQKLKSFTSLVKHVKSFHEETIKIVKCQSCCRKFLSEEEMKEHVCYWKIVGEREPKEPKERSFQCDLCQRTYSSLPYLEAHYPVHPEHQNFKCDQCLKFFYKEAALDSHKKSMHDPETTKKIRPFKSTFQNPYPRRECEHCGQTFAHQYHLARHRVKEHGSTETPIPNKPALPMLHPRNFNCDQCNKSYHLQANLVIHKARHHGVGEAPRKETKLFKHTCQHCKKQMLSWRALVYHLKFIHGETIDESQLVRCTSCRTKFVNNDAMEGHVCHKHTVSYRERLFKCDLCDKDYPVRHDLEVHYAVHPEYHKFKCDQCSKGFFIETELNKHKRNMHKAKEDYIECGTCNRLFKNQQNLKRHQELHTDRVYCCEQCGKKHKTKQLLYSHLKYAHTNPADLMVACTICGKMVKGKKTLNTHMLIHSNDRRFKCSFPSCGKTFITGCTLKIHEQSHTKDYRFKCKFCEYGTIAKKRILLHEQREHNHNRFASEGNV